MPRSGCSHRCVAGYANGWSDNGLRLETGSVLNYGAYSICLIPL